MKLFPKLALTVSGLLIGAIVVLSLSFYWAEARQIRQEVRQEQKAVLGNLVHIAQESFLTNDDLLLVKYAGWIRQWNPAMMSASVVDSSGMVLAHSEPGRISRPASVPGTPTTEMVVLSAPIQQGAHTVGTASVAFSQYRVEEIVQTRLRQVQTRVVSIAFWSLLLGLGVSFGTALSWTRPVRRLAQAAAEIGRGERDLALGSLEARRDELGLLSRSFQQMTEQLKQLDQMKEDFVSAVTHELRSPLGAIESYLNLIAQELHEGISTAAWENYLERLRINTQRLARFVNDLLDVAALERGKIRLEPRPVELVTMAQDVMGLFALKMKEKQLSYDVVGSHDLAPAWADPDKIRHVLMNLVSNAIKFTPPGGTIRIRIEKEQTDGRQRISVIDTGLGITESDQANIFNKFEQVYSARKNIQGPKGTGLGLAICKALIELHGQTLEVQSRLGEGSTFYFALPVAEG